MHVLIPSISAMRAEGCLGGDGFGLGWARQGNSYHVCILP